MVPQSDDPAVQWQLNLYKDVVVKSEEPANPEHTVDRVQSISAAVFHLEQVKKTTALSYDHKYVCTERHGQSIVIIASHIINDHLVNEVIIYNVSKAKKRWSFPNTDLMSNTAEPLFCLTLGN